MNACLGKVQRNWSQSQIKLGFIVNCIQLNRLKWQFMNAVNNFESNQYCAWPILKCYQFERERETEREQNGWCENGYFA